MANMTNALETSVSAAVLRGGTYTGGRLYVGVFTAAPSDTGGGTEANYTGYARVSARSDVQTNADQFTVTDASGAALNSQTIQFPANAGATAQTVTHFGIFDALTSGTMLFHGLLTVTKTIDPTDVVSFPPSSLVITWN